MRRVAVEPARHVVVVKLLAPQHAGERLTHHRSFVVGRIGGREFLIELVGLLASSGYHRREVGAQCARAVVLLRAGRTQSQSYLGGLTLSNRNAVPHRTFAPLPCGIHGVGAGDDMVVDAVFGPAGRGPDAVQPRPIRLVVAEKQLRLGAVGCGPGQQLQLAEERMVDGHRPAHGRGKRRCGVPGIPRPCVAKPHGGQYVQKLGLRAGVGHANRHQDVGGVGLCVGHVDDPVAVVVEDPGIQQLILGIELAASAVLVEQLLVRERPLRVVTSNPRSTFYT